MFNPITVAAAKAGISSTTTYRREVSCIYLYRKSRNNYSNVSVKFLSMTSQNSPSHVDFDFFSAFNSLGELSNTYDLHLFHTHPPDYLRYSAIDYSMMEGWKIGLGIPFYFHIGNKFSKTISYFVCDYKDFTFMQMGMNYFNHHNDIRYLPHIMYGLSSLEEDLTQEGLNIIVDDLNKHEEAKHFLDSLSNKVVEMA